MNGKAKGTRRKGLKIVVIVACGLVSAWLVFVLAYNAWRSPKNVFEEIYWGCIDADSYRATFFEKGVFWPGEYLPAFLNPCKNDSMEKIGASRHAPNYISVTHRNWKDRLEISPAGAWAALFGHWKYTLKDEQSVLSESNANAISDIEISAAGKNTSLSKDDDMLAVDVCLSYSDGHDVSREEGSYIALVRFSIPLDGSPAGIRVTHGDNVDVDDAVRTAKTALVQFLSEYLDAYPESAFQQTNNDDWNWDNVVEEKANYLSWR